MTQVLHILSSSNTQTSFTRQLGKVTIDELKQTISGAKIVERDLVKDTVPHISPEWLGAAFSGQEQPILKQSQELIDEIFAADILVIEAPMYNFGIPSVLKSWVDHIARAGKTFRYTPTGPVGLVTGKRAILVLSSGGIYSEGHMKSFEHQESYLRSVLTFIGITDVEVVQTEGTAMGAESAAKAVEKAKGQAHHAALVSKAA